MNNEGWSLNSLLAGLGVLTFALVFAVVLYDAKIKEIGKQIGTIEKVEKNDYTYIDMEKDLVSAGEAYLKQEYGKHVPEGTMRIQMDTLVENNLYEKPYDLKNKLQTCTGYVTIEVEKNHINYYPYLKCGKNYESKKK